MFSLASLFVDISAKDDVLQAQMSGIHEQMTTLGVAVGTAAGGILTGLIGQALDFIKGKFDQTIGAAMAMDGVERKLNATLGSSAQLVLDQGEAYERSFGIAKEESAAFAEKMAMLALKTGASRQEAAEYGNSMVRMAGDVMSASPGLVSFGDAAQTIYRGSQGAARGLKTLGVTMNETKVEMFAYQQGLTQNYQTLSDSEKAMIRSAFITKQLGAIQGDLGSRINATGMIIKQTAAIWENIYEDLGHVLKGIFGDWVMAQKNVALAAETAFNTVKPYIVSFVASLQDAWAQAKTYFAAIGEWFATNPIVTQIKSTVAMIVETFMPFGKIVLQVIGVMGGLGLAWTAAAVLAAPLIAVASALIGPFLAVIPVAIAVAGVVMLVARNWDAVKSGATTAIGYIQSAVAPLIAPLMRVGAAIKEWILDKVELVAFAWRNLPAFVEVAGLKIYEVVSNIGAYFATIPANLKIIGEYIANNWTKLIYDAFNYVGTVITNLGKKIGELGDAIVAFVTNPMGGFSFDFGKLAEGFKATAAELPALIKPQLMDVSKEIDDRLKAIGEKDIAIKGLDLSGLEALQGAELKAAQAKDAAAAADAKKKDAEARDITKEDPTLKFKSTTMGAADFARKFDEAILSHGTGTDVESQNKTKIGILQQIANNTDPDKQKKPGVATVAGGSR